MNKCKTCGWAKLVYSAPGFPQQSDPFPWCELWAEHAGHAYKKCNGLDHKPRLDVSDDAQW